VADHHEPEQKKKGPKGGIKHSPGRGHDTKSGQHKKKRFGRKAARKRHQKNEAARKLWEAWLQLSDEQRRLLGPKGEPKVPRPDYED
jgi:hypothetical protein